MRTLLLAVTAGVVVVGCGSSTPTSASSATPQPSATAPSAATPSSTGATGGFGDTATNPDAQYVCAAQATESGQVIAYTTVAGADATDAQGVCTAMEQGSKGAWTDVRSISSGSFEATPICWVTASNARVTQRVYTAIPNGDDQATTVLCHDLFSGAGVTPQAS